MPHPYPNDYVRGYFERQWRKAHEGALAMADALSAEAALADDPRDLAVAAHHWRDAAHAFLRRWKAAREGTCYEGGGGRQLDPAVKAALDQRGDTDLNPEDSPVLRNREPKRAPTTARVPGQPREAKCVVCGCTDTRACSPPCAWVSVDYDAGWGICSASKCALTAGVWRMLRDKVRLAGAVTRRA
jgi:hypothetical protein